MSQGEHQIAKNQTVIRRRSGRPRANELQGEALREQIIGATAKVYGLYGFQGSSVELIANEAGVSRPLFYRLFKDRREVIEIVVARANDDLRQRIIAVISQKQEFLTLVSQAIDAYFAWCQSNWLVVGPIYRELDDPESPAGEYRHKVVAELGALLREKAAERGEKPLHPMVFNTLARAVEHIGSHSFWPTVKSELEIQMNRAVIDRIVKATLATPQEWDQVPSLETIRG